MSYTPTEWKSGDVVTSEKLNKLEQGVAGAGGGGVLVVNLSDTGTAIVADKTWNDISSAMLTVFVAHDESDPTAITDSIFYLADMMTNGEDSYQVDVTNMTEILQFVSTSPIGTLTYVYE